MCCRNISSFLLIVLSSCSFSDDNPSISVFTASFDFSKSQDGWEGDFADLPANHEDSAFYELKFAYTDLPSNLGAKKSIMMSGNNHSDDLFMFIKRKIAGLIPNTNYTLVFEIELASDAPGGSVGVGGSPGDSVYLKAGASSVEPAKVVQSNQYVLNLDKGNQSTSGSNVIVLGDIATPSGGHGFKLISRTNASYSAQPFIAQTNSAGEIWLLVGTDSAFEGTTTVYYTKMNIVFSTAY